MVIFIEFWKAKEAWLQLESEKRKEYISNIQPAIVYLVSKGVIMDAWGENTDKSNYKSGFDFYAITRFPSQEILNEFQAMLEQANWYNYFEQTNMSGEDLGVEAILGKMNGL